MNICVTGGAGFIGSHLVDRLIALGHTVLVIDNLTTGVEAFVNPKAIFKKMDIRDKELINVFHDFQPVYVFHEAAQTMVNSSMDDPANDCDVNLMGLINVLEACRHSGVKKIITPSSAAVYGNADSLPLTEDIHGEPSSFYGLTKLTMESYLRVYEQAFNLPYICFRYSNVYGPRQGDGGEGGVISIFARLASEGKAFTVFGDGEQTRDFIYVDDVVQANIDAMNHESITGIYNVSTNTATSVNELIHHFSKLNGKTIDTVYAQERLGDIKHSRLSNIKAQKDLNFVATMNLAEGLTNTYQYFLDEQGAQ